jgi:hypothetical protein
VGFVVNRAPLGQVFSKYFDFLCQSFYRLLYTHNFPLSGIAWLFGTLYIADVSEIATVFIYFSKIELEFAQKQRNMLRTVYTMPSPRNVIHVRIWTL